MGSLQRIEALKMYAFYCLLLLIVKTTMFANGKYHNSLIDEDSPYLLQHAHNAVNWMPWNQKAFNKAKQENKLIFLSIGYSTCHWCHVMEAESFENEEVAKILNEHFISIKVDREEMPHVDKYFQKIHHLINQRSGGWPLNIILTPEQKPFFAATYIPLDKQYGLIGIKQLLSQLQMDFKTDKKGVYAIADNIEQLLKESNSRKQQKRKLNISLVNQFVNEVNASFDHQFYGIGDKPKFPHASTVQTLLDIYRLFKNDTALLLAINMLKAMGQGGIYDQIEGGFYRYSIDEQWQVPHFEKMLYTNAELLSSYVSAYNITGDVFYKNIAQGIITFVQERFENESLLYSASDADSFFDKKRIKKEEGAYFVFSSDEVQDYLSSKGYKEEQIDEVLNYFNITFEGNFENGLSNPYITSKIPPDNLEQIKKDLKAIRFDRAYPFIDNKILTSWNAMYITSLIEANSIDKSFGQKAQQYLDTLIKKLYVNNILYHQRIIGKSLKVKALFEDYAFLIEALLKVYDYSLENHYLILAKKLSDEAIDKFYINEQWFMGNDAFKSPSHNDDSSYKSAQSVMIDNLLKLAVLSDDLQLQEIARKSLELNSYSLSLKPLNSAWLLRSYMAYKKEYIVLKATKEKLLSKGVMPLPFVLKKSDIQKQYLACKIGVCFAFSDNYETIINAIKEEIKLNNFKETY